MPEPALHTFARDRREVGGYTTTVTDATGGVVLELVGHFDTPEQARAAIAPAFEAMVHAVANDSDLFPEAVRVLFNMQVAR